MQEQVSPLWHPCTQMKDFEQQAPLSVTSASGSDLILNDGRRVIDTLSSWWTKSLGHQHPYIREAVIAQANQLEHVMLASTTHDPIERLSYRLSRLMPGLDKVAYASDGASAVEMAMKMSVHSRLLTGQTQRTKFMALAGAYHGETIGALSVSDLGQYREPYQSMLMQTYFIQHVPSVANRQDPLWDDAEFYWKKIEAQLKPYADTLTAILVEPILQAANHMHLYSVDLLKRLCHWCDQHDVHLIADEIMTGFGRTGLMFACQHADITPDFMCLGKTITAGWLPMSAVMVRQEIYDLFYADYKLGRSFLHSHTFAGNPLAAAAANAQLDVLEQEALIPRVLEIEVILHDKMKQLAQSTQQLHNVRGIGTVIAADLKGEGRLGFELSKKAIDVGLLLRPLGNTVYCVLPLNIEFAVIDDIFGKLSSIL